jgi:hypothetical protein
VKALPENYFVMGITLDFDLVYGGQVSSIDKKIITPTERLKNYKGILKGV